VTCVSGLHACIGVHARGSWCGDAVFVAEALGECFFELRRDANRSDPLNVGVPSNGHQPTAGSAKETARHREIGERADVVDAVCVVSEAHGPHKDCRVCTGEQLHAFVDLRLGYAAALDEFIPVSGESRFANRNPVICTIGDEFVVDYTCFNDSLQQCDHQGDVATDVRLDVKIADARAKSKAFCLRRYAEPLQSEFRQRIDDDDFAATLP